MHNKVTDHFIVGYVSAVNSPVGFLAEWWDVFYDIFSSNQAEQAQEPYAEVLAKLF